MDEEDAFGAEAAPRLFGQPIVEFQCRIARQAGAGHFVILAERLPLALMTAVDRLRRDGILAEVVRSAHDAADHIHPEEQVLVLFGAVVPHPEDVTALARAPGPALITIPGGPGTDPAWRIDADANWAGIARLDGTQIRETSAMLGDWDFASTLLRRAAQQGAALHSAGDAVALAPLLDEGAALDRARALLAHKPAATPETLMARALGWCGRMITPHLLRAPQLIPLADPAPLTIGSLGLVASMSGWNKTGLALILLSFLLEAVARPLTALPIGRFRGLGLYSKARRWLAGTALIAAGVHASWISGEPATLIAALWLASLLRPLPLARRWYADPASALVIAFAGFAAGQPLWGMGLAIAHALASQLDAERAQQP